MGTITSRYCHWNEFSNDGNNRSSQTENDKALLGNFQGAKPSPDQLGQAFPVIVFALTLTFVAPYLEELIYRGIFKETLFKRSSFGYHLFYLHLFSLLNMVFQIG